MNEKIEAKLKLLPDSPGVYVMLNKENTVIYVGKAKVLKNRVRQPYFIPLDSVFQIHIRVI